MQLQRARGIGSSHNELRTPDFVITGPVEIYSGEVFRGGSFFSRFEISSEDEADDLPDPLASDVPSHGLTAWKCPDRSSVCVISIFYGRAPHTPRPARVFPRGEQRGLETAAPGCFFFRSPERPPERLLGSSRTTPRVLPPPERGRRSSPREFGEKQEVGMANLAERRPFR